LSKIIIPFDISGEVIVLGIYLGMQKEFLKFLHAAGEIYHEKNIKNKINGIEKQLNNNFV
tara:strand:- start:283 stop:462 length:180 start_codon:yes stop_codon:yes gene_type:complete